MRLTVQSFQRKFDPNSPDIQKKLQEFSETLIQQIDTMSNIASPFPILQICLHSAWKN